MKPGSYGRARTLEAPAVLREDMQKEIGDQGIFAIICQTAS